MTNRVVSCLQTESTLEGLAVRDPRFGFNADSPGLRLQTADFCVPRPEVVLDWEWHLRSPAQPRVQPASKPLEEHELGAIPDRITGRVCADREIQPDRRTPAADGRDGNPVQLPTLEPHDLLVRGTGRRCNVPDTEPGAHARQAMLLSQPAECITGASPASIGWSFSRSHAADHRERRSPADQSSAWSASRTNGRSGPLDLVVPLHSRATWSDCRTKGRARPIGAVVWPSSTAPWSSTGTTQAPCPRTRERIRRCWREH